MFVWGSYNAIQTATKIISSDKYFLDFREQSCDYIDQMSAVPPGAEPKSVQTEEEKAVAKQKCEDQLERERGLRKATDIASSATLIIFGAAIFLFHYRKTELAKSLSG